MLKKKLKFDSTYYQINIENQEIVLVFLEILAVIVVQHEVSKEVYSHEIDTNACYCQYAGAQILNYYSSNWPHRSPDLIQLH